MNAPSNLPSPQGRRVLVATVTGVPGEVIQAWRREHDPAQARRLPPHMTLCYWLPDVDSSALAQQIQHAFPQPITVGLSTVREFDNEEHTFYLAPLDRALLDDARERLYDGTYATLGNLTERWTWHITCVRDSRNRDLDALRQHTSRLVIQVPWTINLVESLELRGNAYERVTAWPLVRDAS